MSAPNIPVRLLRRNQVEERVGMRRSTIYAAIAAGTFPRPIHLGARSVAWVESEVEAWVTARISESRSPIPTDQNL